jgi:threonine synthase
MAACTCPSSTRRSRPRNSKPRKLPYADLAFEVLSRFCDDIREDLRALTQDLRQTCTATRGPATTPPTLRRCAHWAKRAAKLQLLGLSNGPTLAFKDMAMQLLGNLFEYALKRAGLKLNILGATSGDTGSAAEYAMRGKKASACSC